MVDEYLKQITRNSLLQATSDKAEEIRCKLITAGRGKILSYMEKLYEARQILADEAAVTAMTAEQQEANWPLLYGEIGVTADNLVNVATVVVNVYALFKYFEVQINKVEMTGRQGILNRYDDPQAAQDYFNSLVWPDITLP